MHSFATLQSTSTLKILRFPYKQNNFSITGILTKEY